jgi:hypothetical protein
VPALLVHAADDPLAPYDGAVRLAGRLRGARLVTLPRGGHLQLGKARAELRSVVEGFLNELRVPTSPELLGASVLSTPLSRGVFSELPDHTVCGSSGGPPTG